MHAMLSSRKTIDAASTRNNLDVIVATIRHEGEGADADPFDDAMVAALLAALGSVSTRRQ